MYIKCIKLEKKHKLAIVFIIVLIVSGIIFLNRDGISLKKKIQNFFGSISIRVSKIVCVANYNTLSYGKFTKMTANTDVYKQLENYINSQNMLFSYIKESEKEIKLKIYDPAYKKANDTKEENYTDMGIYKYTGYEKSSDVMDNQLYNEKESAADHDNISDVSADAKVNNNVGENQIKDTGQEAGITYTLDELKNFDFLMSKLYTVPERALVYESDLNAAEMLSKDMRMKTENSNPQILIYHTHSQEGFADSVDGDDSTNIVAAGTYLSEILSEKYGYNVIHCTEHFDIKSGKLDRSKAYTYATSVLEQILQDNPTVEVIIDVHRDGLKEGAPKLLTNINGKETAKIMFFNGVSRSRENGDIDYLYNRYRADNLAFSFKLKLKAMELYPDFTRKNYIDAYQYNLHLRPKSVLVEAGAQNNTLEEELNAMEVLAKILHEVLKNG